APQDPFREPVDLKKEDAGDIRAGSGRNTPREFPDHESVVCGRIEKREQDAIERAADREHEGDEGIRLRGSDAIRIRYHRVIDPDPERDGDRGQDHERRREEQGMETRWYR